MNILFVSHIGNSVAAGPSWSIPAKVKAQTECDNILWVNISESELPHYRGTGVFHKVSEFGGLKLSNLPTPFNNPDLVAFEGFYSIPSVRFAKELVQNNIPYIITPRGSLTIAARHNKSRLKKDIAHILMFDAFLKHARSIQYLTRQEMLDSRCPNKNCYILPNGFDTPSVVKTSFSQDAIKAVYIGRIDIYHKGLDILMKAMGQIKDKLGDSFFSLDVYGPQNEDSRKLQQMIDEYGLSEMVKLKGEVKGKEKESALLGADVFVLTSRTEGHPMGLVEALAYGVPSIVTPGTRMMEEIESSGAGWTCSESTEQGIAEMLLKVIAEKNQLFDRSRKALELARNYDWGTLAQKFHKEAELLI